MNTFKRVLIVLTVVLGSLFLTTGAANARPSMARCISAKTYLHYFSKTHRACARNGWHYANGVSINAAGETINWHYVIGPNGVIRVNVRLVVCCR